MRILPSRHLFLNYGGMVAWLFTLAPLCVAAPKPELKAVPKPDTVETHWPGVTVTVHEIARLPDNRVSVKFIYRAGSQAPAETYIADRPLKSFSGESNSAQTEPVKFAPYSLEDKGKLIDEATGKVFPSSELKPGDAVDPGRMDAMELLRPDGGFFLGAVFECPPLNQDDPPKAQWVSFNLPGLKKPLGKVLLPREENVVLEFYPRRRPRPTAPVTTPTG